MYRQDSKPLGQGRLWRWALSFLKQPFHGLVKPETDDLALVGHAAQVAAVSEFDLFRAAWQQWHGYKPEERLVERDFALYLRCQKVPGYLRHFARRVAQQAANQGLDAAALGVEGYRRREALVDLRCGLSVECLSLVLLASLALFI